MTCLGMSSAAAMGFRHGTDAAGLRLARQAAVLTATPRTGLGILEESGVQLDALIGSGRDPGSSAPGSLSHRPGCALPPKESWAAGVNRAAV